MSLRLRPWDFAIMVLGILAFSVSILWSAKKGEGELMVMVSASGVEYLMPLSEEGFLDIEGPIGITTVNVSGGEAFISYSDCKEKIGINMGGISEESRWIACLPNNVLVKIVARDSAGDSGKGSVRASNRAPSDSAELGLDRNVDAGTF